MRWLRRKFSSGTRCAWCFTICKIIPGSKQRATPNRSRRRRTSCRKQRRISVRKAFRRNGALYAEDARTSRSARHTKKPCSECSICRRRAPSYKYTGVKKPAFGWFEFLPLAEWQKKQRRCGSRSVFGEQILATGPCYLPFLGAFLSAFLAFFAMKNLLLTFSVQCSGKESIP